MNIDKRKLVVGIIGSGMFLFLLYSFVLNHYWGIGYPYNTFLCSPVDRFMDFYNVNFFINELDPYSPEKSVSYPPFALLLAYPFSLFFKYNIFGSVAARENILAVSSYLILLIMFSVFLVRVIYFSIKGLDRKTNIVYTIILFLTYPVLFLLDRGNYTMITFVFVYFFVYYYKRGSQKSLFFLSAAVAMKIYPILFILLFLTEKRYNYIAKTVVITFVFSIVPVLFFDGSCLSNVEGFVHNLLFFSQGYVNEVQNMSWSASLFGIIKIPIMLLNQGVVPSGIKIVYLMLVVLIVIGVYMLLKNELQFNKRVIYLITLQILIMPISPDYNLIYLYIPLLLLLGDKKAEFQRDDYFFVVIIALLFIPKSYGIFFSDGIWAVSIQSFINPVLLVLLIMVPCIQMLRKRYLLIKDRE